MTTWTIIYHKEAKKEFDEAYDWYESQKEGLGEQFANCIEDAVNRLKINPNVHRKVYKDVRKKPVRRFPYCVFYVIEAECIQVISVFHTKRHPRGWQTRV